RRASLTKMSMSRMAQAITSRKISALAGARSGSTKFISESVMSISGLLNLGQGHVAQQIVDRGVHHLGEGQRMQAHVQRAGGEQRKYKKLAAVDVLHLLDVVVADLAEDDALVHPQCVGGTDDQRG